MRVLVAEDDATSRRVLEVTLRRAGYEVVTAADGEQALAALLDREGPRLAVLDWMMPGLDGPEVVRRVREAESATPAYLVMLTARNEQTDVVRGLGAGADDYLRKPFDHDELLARVAVGARFAGLQAKLAARLTELEAALAHVKRLQGMMPICSYCKMVRNDQDYWQTIESYLSQHSEAVLSHSICPGCYQNVALPQFREFIERRKDGGD